MPPLHFLWGSGLSSKPDDSSPSYIATRFRLPPLLAGIRDAFFRSVSHPLCLLDLKIRVSKLARGIEAFSPGEDVKLESRAREAGIALDAKSCPGLAATLYSGSHSPMSAQLIRDVRPVFLVVLPLLVVLDKGGRPAAIADDSG